MPLIRLPKIRSHKEAKSSERDGDTGSLASGRKPSVTSLKSLGTTGEEDAGYHIVKVKDLPKLHRAVWKCNLDKVKVATKGIKTKDLNAFDKGRRTALHLACSKAHKEIIIHLCSLHADVNLQDSDGATSMHKLIETKNTECLSTLIACGGNVNLTDRFGQSPLHLVAKIGDVEASIVLLEANATVDSKDENGLTALHVATQFGHRKLVASLIDDGFYIDAQDGQGRTCLMIAAGEGWIGLLKLLTENKADPELKDNNTFKAFDYAMNKNFPECARLIEEHQKTMEGERQLQASKPSPQPLVDPSLIAKFYGPPSDHERHDSSSKDDDSPFKDEDSPAKVSAAGGFSASVDPWPDTDSAEEEDGLTAEASKTKLRETMQKYSSLKKLKTTPTDSSPQHYRLSTENKTDQGVVSPLRGGVRSDRDDSVDRVSKDDEAVTTTPRSKLESHPSSPASKQRGEDEGDDVDYHPRGATALSYDGDLESSVESEQPVEEEISDDWDSIDDDSEGGGELGYTPWTSLAGSDRPTNRRTSPLSSPFTSPVHGVLPVSPLTKSLHSGDVSPSTSTDKAAKTPSVSVDVGGMKTAQSGQKQSEEGSSLTPTLSSSADGGGLTSKLSSAVDGLGGGGLPQNLSSNVDEKAGHGLAPNLSSNADGVMDGRGLAPTARDPKFGGILAPSLSSNADAKSGSIVAPSLSSNADGRIGGNGLTPRLSTAADAEFGSSLAPCRSTPADIPSTVASPRSGSADAAVLEDVLTQDDEVSEFDSEDYDHVEDVVALLTATPAQPTSRTAGRDNTESQAQTAHSAHVKQSPTPRKHVATPPIGAVTPSSEASLVAVSPLLSEGKAAASVTRTSQKGEGKGKEDGSDFFNTDDEDEIEKLLSQAEELRPLKTATSNEKTAAVSVTATSILMKTEQEAEDLEEEEEMSDKKEVGDSQLKKEWPQDQNVEARYEDSEWDSEEEEEEEEEKEIVTLHSVKAPAASRDKVKKVESDRDEKMKALLTSFCRREDRGPPQTGLTASVEETVSKMASSVKKEEADKKDVIISNSHASDKPSLEGDVDARYEDSEWDSEGDEKGEENLTAPPSKKSVTFTTPVTFDVEVGKEEEAGGREEGTYDALLPDSSLPKKSASLSLLTSQLGDLPPLKLPQSVASSDDVIESGQPLVPKLTYMNLPSEKTEGKEKEDEDGRKAAKNIAHLEDSLAPTKPATVDTATTSIVEESVTAKEAEPAAKSSIHMEKEASSPSSKRRPELQDDVNVHVAKQSENIQSLTPVSKKDGPLPSSLAKDVSGASKAVPKESGWKLPLDVRPISLHPVAGSGQSSVTRSTGDRGRGFDRRGNRDDTEDDLTSTESDLSPVNRTPRLLNVSLTRPTPNYSSTPSQPHDAGGVAGEGSKKPLDELEPQSSLSELTSQLDTQEQLSEASKMSDDLPLSPLMRLNHSMTLGNGGTALLNSSHAAQLEESLRETRRVLDHSQNARQVTERAKRQLEAQLSDSQRRHGEVAGAKATLENSKIDLELEVRKLQYEVDQAREALKSSEGVNVILRANLKKTEARLSREVEDRQASELRKKEAEIAERTLSLATKQLREELTEVKLQLQGEREAKQLQDNLFREQSKMFQTLQDESKKAEDQKNTFVSRLQAADASKTNLEVKMSELMKVNSDLQVQMAADKRKMDDVVSQLEGEVESLKKQLEERDQKQVLAEESLLVSKQQFEGHLTEMCEKNDMLSSTLNGETERRKKTEDEVSTLKSRLDEAVAEVQGLKKEEKALTQQLEEIRREVVVGQKDLEAARDKHHQLTQRNTLLENQLQQRDGEQRSLQAQLQERANQIAALQREADQKGVHISSIKDEVRSVKNEREKLNLDLGVANEKSASLQLEVAMLREQLSSTSQAREKLDSQTQDMVTRMDETKSHYDDKLHGLMEQLASTKEELVRKESALNVESREKEMAQSEVARVSSSLQAVQESVKVLEGVCKQIEEDKKELSANIRRLEEQLVSSKSDISKLERERIVLEEKEKGLHAQIERLNEDRSALEERVENLQNDVNALEDEAEKTKHGHEQLIAQERRKTAAALKMSDKAEAKLKEESAKFNSETEALRSQLKALKRRVQQLQELESKVPEMREEFDRERVALQGELNHSKASLEASEIKAKRELEQRRKAEQDCVRYKKELDVLQTRLVEGETDSYMREQELARTTKLNKKLTDKLKSLKEHVAANMVSITDMEEYKKLVDEKARQQVSRKLAEVDAHLEQQSQAQEALARLRSVTESEWKDKYERSTEEMRYQLGKAVSDKDSMMAEARRFKDLYEMELQHSDKLNSRLRKAKDETSEAQRRLSLEQSRTQQLLHMTQGAASSLSPSIQGHHSFKPGSSGKPRSLTDELLSSVRAELDTSIARHMDTATVPLPGSPKFATRSTSQCPNQLSSSKHSHLQSIKRNYHI